MGCSRGRFENKVVTGKYQGEQLYCGGEGGEHDKLAIGGGVQQLSHLLGLVVERSSGFFLGLVGFSGSSLLFASQQALFRVSCLNGEVLEGTPHPHLFCHHLMWSP